MEKTSGEITVEKRSRGSRERRKRKIARHSVCERETHGYRGISRDPSWRNFARMSFRAPRSMMVQCRDKNSFPVDEKKKERKKELKESRGETTRNLHFRQSRDELGGERSDDLVFTFSKGRSFFSSSFSFYTVDYPNAFVFKLNSFFLTDHPREFQNWFEYFYRNWIKLNLLFITIISIYKLCHFETFRSTIQNYICNFTLGIHHRWRRITGIIKENWNYQIHNIVSKRFNDERRKDLVTCVTSNWFLDFITLESDGFRE